MTQKNIFACLAKQASLITQLQKLAYPDVQEVLFSIKHQTNAIVPQINHIQMEQTVILAISQAIGTQLRKPAINALPNLILIQPIQSV